MAIKVHITYIKKEIEKPEAQEIKTPDVEVEQVEDTEKPVDSLPEEVVKPEQEELKQEPKPKRKYTRKIKVAKSKKKIKR